MPLFVGRAWWSGSNSEAIELFICRCFTRSWASWHKASNRAVAMQDKEQVEAANTNGGAAAAAGIAAGTGKAVSATEAGSKKRPRDEAAQSSRADA